MPWIRTYVDYEITDKGGGDHSRVIDLELNEDEITRGGGPAQLGVTALTDAGLAKLELESNEVAGAFAELSVPSEEV